MKAKPILFFGVIFFSLASSYFLPFLNLLFRNNIRIYASPFTDMIIIYYLPGHVTKRKQTLCNVYFSFFFIHDYFCCYSRPARVLNFNKIIKISKTVAHSFQPFIFIQLDNNYHFYEIHSNASFD